MKHSFRIRASLYVLTILVVGLAGWLRLKAVKQLPVDFDELVYLPVSFRYAEMFAGGQWKQIVSFQENMEHPPLNKLLTRWHPGVFYTRLADLIWTKFAGRASR